MKKWKVQLDARGRGKVEVDGREVTGACAISVCALPNAPPRLQLTVYPSELEVEGDGVVQQVPGDGAARSMVSEETSEQGEAPRHETGRAPRRQRFDREALWVTALTHDVHITPDEHVLVRDEGAIEWQDLGELAPGVTVEQALEEVADARAYG